MKQVWSEITEKLEKGIAYILNNDPELKNEGARYDVGDGDDFQQRLNLTISGEPYTVLIFKGHGEADVDFTEVRRAEGEAGDRTRSHTGGGP